MNDAIFFSLTNPVFLFILVIGVFSFGGNVELETILRLSKEIVIFGGRGGMVYAGISIDGRTDLLNIRNGARTGQRYRDEILRLIVVPYAAAIDVHVHQSGQRARLKIKRIPVSRSEAF